MPRRALSCDEQHDAVRADVSENNCPAREAPCGRVHRAAAIERARDRLDGAREPDFFARRRHAMPCVLVSQRCIRLLAGPSMIDSVPRSSPSAADRETRRVCRPATRARGSSSRRSCRRPCRSETPAGTCRSTTWETARFGAVGQPVRVLNVFEDSATRRRSSARAPACRAGHSRQVRAGQDDRELALDEIETTSAFRYGQRERFGAVAARRVDLARRAVPRRRIHEGRRRLAPCARTESARGGTSGAATQAGRVGWRRGHGAAREERAAAGERRPRPRCERHGFRAARRRGGRHHRSGRDATLELAGSTRPTTPRARSPRSCAEWNRSAGCFSRHRRIDALERRPARSA